MTIHVSKEKKKITVGIGIVKKRDLEVIQELLWKMLKKITNVYSLKNFN